MFSEHLISASESECNKTGNPHVFTWSPTLKASVQRTGKVCTDNCFSCGYIGSFFFSTWLADHSLLNNSIGVFSSLQEITEMQGRQCLVDQLLFFMALQKRKGKLVMLLSLNPVPNVEYLKISSPDTGEVFLLGEKQLYLKMKTNNFSFSFLSLFFLFLFVCMHGHKKAFVIARICLRLTI